MSISVVGLVIAGASAAVSGTCLFEWRSNVRARDSNRRRVRAGLGAENEGRKPGGSRGAKQRQKLDIERHIPEMIDALCLGMRAGMSFERAFRAYCFRFDDELAQSCRKACLAWESGLVSRDDALRAMARDSGVGTLQRLVDNCTRCLRFGSPMNRMLESLAAEARASYRAKMEEKVAKAPVKMLVPTAALILPAMLILVMAPVLLEFIG